MLKRASIFMTGLVAGLALLASCSSSSVPPAIPQDAKMEKEIRKILKTMTLEEKVGQMTQLTVGTVMDKKSKRLDEEKLAEIIGKYKVGSILNVPGDVSCTKETYKEILAKIQEVSIAEIGIPCLYGLDQIHGATYTDGAVFFPQEINLAATFNRAYPKIMGEITAYETRACMVPWTFAPVMDLGREPRWPRMWESFGEDVFMNAEMAVQSVKGIQGEDPNNVDKYHLSSCIKHYMAYGVPDSGQDRTPSSVTEREMREKYFEPFRRCIEEGKALSLMVNSASNNGVPFHANYEYLTKWLKEDLNWDGLIVTDWADINNLYKRERIAKGRKEAIAMAINAGIDMSMEPYSTAFCTDLVELVNEGKVPMSRIDDAVLRVLRLKYRLGLFENPVWTDVQYPDFASEKFEQQAYQAAVESEVLLKNNGILPLSRDAKILVTGPNADMMRSLNGGWSYTWQGHRADEFAGRYNTIREALTAEFGEKNVRFEQGVVYDKKNWWQDHDAGIDKAVRAARSADVIIACVGENSYCETPGNSKDLNLSENQQELVKRLASTGKPVVLVLNEGRPRIINSLEPLASAVVDIMLPGNYGADALANLLSGDENFSGRLPFTYPKFISTHSPYDYKVSENVATMQGMYNYDAVMDVQWTFGHGLSYTSFEYSDFTVDKLEFNENEELTFTVKVKNTGKRPGKEAVMLFSSDIVASLVPEVRRLRDFEKISLEPGEEKTVEMKIRASELAFVGTDGKWRLEAGEFRMQCGSESLNVACKKTKVWDTPNIPGPSSF